MGSLTWRGGTSWGQGAGTGWALIPFPTSAIQWICDSLITWLLYPESDCCPIRRWCMWHAWNREQALTQCDWCSAGLKATVLPSEIKCSPCPWRHWLNHWWLQGTPGTMTCLTLLGLLAARSYTVIEKSQPPGSENRYFAWSEPKNKNSPAWQVRRNNNLNTLLVGIFAILHQKFLYKSTYFIMSWCEFSILVTTAARKFILSN